MIKFNIRESITDPGSLFLTWSLFGETKTNCRKTTKPFLNSVKASIIRQEVINACERLYKQRIAVYNHTGYYRESILLSSIALEKKIPQLYSIHNMKGFFDFVEEQILPGLFELCPGQLSKYKNYRPTLEKLEEFTIKCRTYYTIQENERNTKRLQETTEQVKSVNNQRILEHADYQVNKEIEFPRDLFSITT